METHPQNEELEVLHSIFGDAWATFNPESAAHTIPINAHWRLVVSLPSSYPSHDAPVFELFSSKSGSAEQIQGLAERLEAMFAEQVGAPILFQWIELLKSELEEPEAAVANIAESLDEFDLDSLSGDAEAAALEEYIADEAAEAARFEQRKLQFKESQLECPEILHDEPFTDRKSTFQTPAEVARVRYELMQNGKIARATHNIMAYRIVMPNGAVMQDCDDDGEHGASQRMLHVMQILDVRNVVVVISRWFGGILLGADRFKHINNAARNALVKYKYCQVGDSKKKKK